MFGIAALSASVAHSHDGHRADLPLAGCACPCKPQFDTYRFMRALTGDDWSVACPGTNCLWMAYLAETLALEKLGAGPGVAAQKSQLRAFRWGPYGSAGCIQMYRYVSGQGFL
jgi:hypothetical protein